MFGCIMQVAAVPAKPCSANLTPESSSQAAAAAGAGPASTVVILTSPSRDARAGKCVSASRPTCRRGWGLCAAGRLGNMPASLEDKANLNTSLRQHLHQHVNAEQVDPAPDEIADARLRHAEQLRGCGLRQPPSLDQLAYVDHELRAQPQILGFLGVEPEVPEHVATRTLHLGRHSPSYRRCLRRCSKSPNHVRANSMSTCAVRITRLPADVEIVDYSRLTRSLRRWA